MTAARVVVAAAQSGAVGKHLCSRMMALEASQGSSALAAAVAKDPGRLAEEGVVLSVAGRQRPEAEVRTGWS